MEEVETLARVDFLEAMVGEEEDFPGMGEEQEKKELELEKMLGYWSHLLVVLVFEHCYLNFYKDLKQYSFI